MDRDKTENPSVISELLWLDYWFDTPIVFDSESFDKEDKKMAKEVDSSDNWVPPDSEEEVLTTN